MSRSLRDRIVARLRPRNRVACGSPHPDFGHVTCHRPAGHRGRHGGPSPVIGAPPDWLRWKVAFDEEKQKLDG